MDEPRPWVASPSNLSFWAYSHRLKMFYPVISRGEAKLHKKTSFLYLVHETESKLGFLGPNGRKDWYVLVELGPKVRMFII